MEKEPQSSQKKKMSWNNSPRSEYYMDDNALYILNAISRGHFSGKMASFRFFVASCQPIEWDNKTLIEFLIRTSEEYKMKLKNFETMIFAFSEELLKTSMTRNIKNSKTKYSFLKLKCLNIKKLTTIIKLLSQLCFL